MKQTTKKLTKQKTSNKTYQKHKILQTTNKKNLKT